VDKDSAVYDSIPSPEFTFRLVDGTETVNGTLYFIGRFVCVAQQASVTVAFFIKNVVYVPKK